jgi:hypothetical protein
MPAFCSSATVAGCAVGALHGGRHVHVNEADARLHRVIEAIAREHVQMPAGIVDVLEPGFQIRIGDLVVNDRLGEHLAGHVETVLPVAL